MKKEKMETVSIFEKLTPEGKAKTCCFKAGETIYNEGEEIKGVYLLKDGCVRISKKNKMGKSTFLWSAKPGEPLGFISIFQGSDYYTSSVITGEQISELLLYSKKEFVQLLSQHLELKLMLFRMLCKRIHFMEIRSKKMLSQSTDERIVETLLFLASNKKENNKCLRIDYSIKELNEIIGGSQDYLQKKIKNMKDKKLIDYGINWLVINDIEKLRLISKQ
ncbi:MAG: Crp/Fnr family transcriptional regulator [Flavobacteriales bacterium]|nr:Crp/Fnr family transcriptional regulator [Flavobacteriales bacterium]